jgi:hypothetical protein
MNRQLTAKMSAHLTPEQKAAAQEAIRRAGYASDNEALHALLAELCQRQGVEWPSVELPFEGKNYRRGKGGKFVPKP